MLLKTWGLLLCLLWMTCTAALSQNAKTQVMWLGQSAFKIVTPAGKVILTDPWLIANPKTPPEFKNPTN